MDTYRIVLADDHMMFRKGVRKILEGVSDIRVVGEAKDGIELLSVLKKEMPDMVILDIPIPNLRGIEATQVIKMINPEIKILVLSEHKGRSYVHQAISAGAEGYLLKEDGDGELLSAIERIKSGKNYISPLLPVDLLDGFSVIFRDYNTLGDSLTPRESEIVKLIAQGKTSKEIASMLFISVRTVESHRLNIMRKLNVKNTPELVRYAMLKEFVSH